MANRIFEVSADLCHCTVVAPTGGEHRLPVRKIGDLTCHIDSDLELPANEYVDARLDLQGVGERALFAHVVSSGEDGLILRWLHFDPGDAVKLDEALGEFATQHGLEAQEDPSAQAVKPAEAGQPSAGNKGRKTRKKETRRVVRPRATAPAAATGGTGSEDDDEAEARHTRRVTRPARSDDVDPLFPDDDLPPEAGKPTTTVTPFEQRSDQGGERRGTRRVVRPRTAATAPAADDELAPTDSGDAPSGGRGAIDGGGDQSGARHVVIAQTDQFQKLPEQEQKPAESGTRRESVTVRRNIRGGDGKLDVGASIRSRAKTVRASELAARHDKVRVLNMSTIKELIQDAVAEAMERLGGSIDEAEKRRLLEEAEEEFQERLKAFKAEKEGWAAQQQNLENQLQRAQRMLDDERNKAISADQFTVSEGGLEALEQRFNRLLTAAIKSNGVNDVLADELRGMVTTVLDQEREKIAEQARQAQNDAIALLEKKVGRLASSLEASEKERDRARRHAAALEAAGGGISGQAIFSEFADEEDKARKLELLKVVFEQNKEMRQQLKQQGVVIKARKKPKPLPSAEEAADVSAEAETEGAEASAPATDDGAAVEEPAAAEAVAASAAAEGGDDDGEDPYADMVDPDDMPWQPGMKVQTDVAGDNEDAGDDGGVKKIAADAAQLAPPPIQVTAAAGADGAADATGEDSADEVAEDAYAGSLDPDDLPWQPGMKVQTDVAGDNEDEDEEEGGIKKLAAANNQLEPPPITIRKPGD